MPRFSVLGKYQRYGSDDFVVPAAVEAVTTGTWLATFGYIYARQHAILTCSEFVNLHPLYVGGILFSSVNLGLLMIIVRNALRGTIINAWPRRTLQKWIGLKAGVSVLSGLSLLLATKWVYMGTYTCDDTVTTIMKRAVKFMYVPTFFGLYTVVSYILPSSQILIERRQKPPENLETTTSVTQIMKKTWHQRVFQLSRLLGMEGHAAFMRLGSVLAVIFHDDPDIVPTDVIATLLVLSHKQQRKLKQLKSDEEKLIDELKNPDHTSCKPKPWMTVSNAAHYMKYGLACYGWTHYVYTSRSAVWGFCKVLCRARYIPRSCPDHIHGDNTFLGNTTAVTMATGLEIEDFVYITFHNQLFEVPFFVALDHEKRSIVVSIRGTLSMKDVITDLISFGESMTLAHVPNAQAHEGMHSSAKLILKKLIEGDNPILEQAKIKLQKLVGMEKAKTYQLVLTGHSLGAGVAAILAILLREIEGYEDLICFSYSPPGGLLSIEASRYSEDFVCSVVIEDDIVARLGLTNMYKFKLLDLNIMQTLDVPKHEAFRKPLERVFARLFKPSQERTEGKKHSWDGNPEATKMVEEFQAGIEKAKQHTLEELKQHRQLYLPGCVLYLQGLGRGKELKSYFTRGDSEFFQEIMLCNNMILHHFPAVVLNTLRRLDSKDSIPTIV